MEPVSAGMTNLMWRGFETFRIKHKSNHYHSLGLKWLKPHNNAMFIWHYFLWNSVEKLTFLIKQLVGYTAHFIIGRQFETVCVHWTHRPNCDTIIWKSEVCRSLGISIPISEDNIKVDIKETWCVLIGFIWLKIKTREFFYKHDNESSEFYKRMETSWPAQMLSVCV